MKLSINEEKTVTILAEKFWNETGIEIAKGEEYKFEAEGSWKDLTIEADADGYSKAYMTLFTWMKRSRINPWFALMGSIDKNNDFMIGKKNRIPFQKYEGKLYCYANDAKWFYGNNSGMLRLKVTRVR